MRIIKPVRSKDVEHEGPDPLGRYYTKPHIGSLLISEMGHLAPKRILDLGSGRGDLSRAAIEKWQDAEVLTVDIDTTASTSLRRAFGSNHRGRHKHILADVFSASLTSVVSEIADEIDTAICNPPFTTPRWRPHYAHMLEDAGFSSCLPMLETVDAALLFMAQNLRILRSEGTLGIILPDTLISAAKHREFRKQLISRYTLIRVVRLPRRSFVGTDALAHILVLKKIAAQGEPIALTELESAEKEILLDRDAAIDRLDFSYHQQNRKPRKHRGTQLADICVEFARGSLSSAQGRKAKFPVLHTADIDEKCSGVWCDLRRFTTRYAPASLIRARPGDILLGRVGRNLERKVIGVARGFPVLTDCVYRLRVERKYRRALLQALACEEGRLWLASRSYGVGARQLSKADLMSFMLRGFPRKRRIGSSHG